METVRLLCILRDVSSLVDFYPSDLMPQSITQTTTVIVNFEPHTQGSSRWLAVHYQPKFSSAYYFESYCNLPLLPSVQAFNKRNFRTWDFKRRHLQDMTTNVCGTYCCPFALHIDRGLQAETIHLPLRCLHPHIPGGGAVIQYRIPVPDISWRLGSMLPQLPVKVGT